MYTPARFAETRTEVLHALIAAHPLGALVTYDAGGLDADHIPFEIEPHAPLGVLRAHVARANPLWRRDGEPVMVLFEGASGYVPPARRARHLEDRRVVPTWDYAVVHAHGTLRCIDDPARLLPLLQRQTAHHEAAEAAPWTIGDAPRDYIEQLMKAIVGIEIVIDRLEGKWKTG